MKFELDVEQYMLNKTDFKKAKELCLYVLDTIRPCFENIDDEFMRTLNRETFDELKVNLVELFTEVEQKYSILSEDSILNAIKYLNTEVKIIISSDVSDIEKQEELFFMLLGLPEDYKNILQL